MKKIFAAIVLATLTIGSAGARASAQEQDNISPAEHKRLFREGAKLWPIYCNTCHNARPGSEKAPYEWDHDHHAYADARKFTGQTTPERILEYLKAR